MLKVGLTGGIGSGKSTVAGAFRTLGARVADSDRITHELLEPEQSVYRAVVAEFGTGILTPQGRIDRRVLGSRVFGDPRLREILNGLVHPAVAERQERFLRETGAGDPHAVAIVDAALMIETGSFRRYDRIIVVRSTRSQQFERLLSRGLEPEEIDRRIDSQMPIEAKLEYADYVIDNRGTPRETQAQVERVWEELRAEAASR